MPLPRPTRLAGVVVNEEVESVHHNEVRLEPVNVVLQIKQGVLGLGLNDNEVLVCVFQILTECTQCILVPMSQLALGIVSQANARAECVQPVRHAIRCDLHRQEQDTQVSTPCVKGCEESEGCLTCLSPA